MIHRAIIGGAIAALSIACGAPSASAQGTIAHTRLGIEYGVLQRVVDSADMVITRSAGRTMDASSRVIVTSLGAWTLVAELVTPVPAGLDAFVVLARGGRVRLTAGSPRAAVVSSPTRCDRCPTTIQWQFVSSGPTPVPLPPRVRFVIQAGVVPLAAGQP